MRMMNEMIREERKTMCYDFMEKTWWYDLLAVAGLGNLLALEQMFCSEIDSGDLLSFLQNCYVRVKQYTSF